MLTAVFSLCEVLGRSVPELWFLYPQKSLTAASQWSEPDREHLTWTQDSSQTAIKLESVQFKYLKFIIVVCQCFAEVK